MRDALRIDASDAEGYRAIGVGEDRATRAEPACLLIRNQLLIPLSYGIFGAPAA